MKKTQLSIASLLFAGLFATGCSQQQIQEPEPMPTPAPEPMPTPEPIPEPVPAPPPVVVRPAPVVKPVPRRPTNPNCHSHPSNAMTKSIQHCHKNPRGQHHYGQKAIKRAPTPFVRPTAKPQVDVRALQRKLKAKGYYRGAIDGVVGTGTRDALKRFQNR